MTTEQIFQFIRDKIKGDDLYLSQIAKRAKVNYYKLRRFFHGDGTLSLDEARNLILYYTGKELISSSISDPDALK